MKFPKKWFKDVVVVQFPDNGYKGERLILPPGIKHVARLVEAKVIAIGTKFRYKDDVRIGDTIIVDSHMGTRRTFDAKGDCCTFDFDDIYAVIPK